MARKVISGLIQASNPINDESVSVADIKAAMFEKHIPFIEQAERRDLRKALQFKFWNRAAEANVPLLEEAVKLRAEIASLFGLPTWAHHAMELKMAKTPEAVTEFYDSIVPQLRRKAARSATCGSVRSAPIWILAMIGMASSRVGPSSAMSTSAGV